MGSVMKLDALEGWRLMSVSMFPEAGTIWDDAPAAVVMPAAVRTVSPSAVAKKTVPAVVGTWTGTCKVAGTTKASAISMKIERQTGVAAVGQFNFGPITGGKPARSTALLSTKGDRGFTVIFNVRGSGYYASVTAAISSNGKQILGRWAYNGRGGWVTGTLVLDLK